MSDTKKRTNRESFDNWSDSYDEWNGSVSWEGYASLLRRSGSIQKWLELGAGTGLLTIPLAENLGGECVALDFSQAMLSQLEQKLEQSTAVIRTVCDDMATFELDVEFDLICCLRSSLYHLLGHDELIACLSNVFRHLRPGGKFIADGFILDPSSMVPRRQMIPHPIQSGVVNLSITQVDDVHQTIDFQEISLGPTTSIRSIHSRYIRPAEFALLAKICGFECEIYGGLDREPLTSQSKRLVAVLTRPEHVDVDNNFSESLPTIHKTK